MSHPVLAHWHNKIQSDHALIEVQEYLNSMFRFKIVDIKHSLKKHTPNNRLYKPLTIDYVYQNNLMTKVKATIP